MPHRARELVIVLFLFALALCALLALYRLPKSESTELGPKFALALLVAAVTRLLMLGLDTLRERDPAASFGRLGMRSVSSSLDEGVLRDRLAGARTIKVLKTWFPENRTIQKGLDLAIRQNGAS